MESGENIVDDSDAREVKAESAEFTQVTDKIRWLWVLRNAHMCVDDETTNHLHVSSNNTPSQPPFSPYYSRGSTHISLLVAQTTPPDTMLLWIMDTTRTL